MHTALDSRQSEFKASLLWLRAWRNAAAEFVDPKILKAKSINHYLMRITQLAPESRTEQSGTRGTRLTPLSTADYQGRIALEANIEAKRGFQIQMPIATGAD